MNEFEIETLHIVVLEEKQQLQASTLGVGGNISTGKNVKIKVRY